MKWNWGSKLLIAIIIFMSFIFVLVYLTTKIDTNLVEKDYYPKGLKYQDRIDEIKNAEPYKRSFKIFKTEKAIAIQFPAIQPDSGTILFFRPSNTKYDRLIKIDLDPAFLMEFPKSEFVKGKYLVKISWSENGKQYYFEKPFNFN